MMVKSKSKNDYEWLVERRADIHRVLLSIYLFLKENRKALLAGEERHRSVFGLLIGAAFSLWRAAFLTGSTRGWKKIFDHAEKFLERVVRDNAINYTQDKETLNWAVGYYLNNARYRIDRVLSKLTERETQGVAAFTKFQRMKRRGIDDTDPKVVWNTVFQALCELFTIPQKAVLAGPKRRLTGRSTRRPNSRNR